MRTATALLLSTPALLLAQGAPLDDGRLDPAWFGPSAVLQPAKELGFQWLKPGLSLKGRSLRLKGWEPAAWVTGRRAMKDRAFLDRVQALLPGALEKGLQRSLKDVLPVSTADGDLLLLARVADAVGQEDDYLAMGSLVLSVDLKVLDGDTGELLAAFHDTHRGPTQESVLGQLGKWSEGVGRMLATAVVSPAPVGAVLSQAKPAPPPAYDLEGALRRIDGLKRDGLIGEDEWKSLRQKAIDKAK